MNVRDRKVGPVRRLAFVSALLAIVAAASITVPRNTDSAAGPADPLTFPSIRRHPRRPVHIRAPEVHHCRGGLLFRGLPAWAHGYVGGGEGRRSERNLAKILSSITNMNPHVDATRVVDVGDPDLFQYPVVYATEAGFMELDDREAHALGDYLRKGGFVIFDDFRGEADWENFRSTMQRVLPGEQPTELALSNPIFHAFFDIQTLQFVAGPTTAARRSSTECSRTTISRSRCSSSPTSTTTCRGTWEYSDTGFTPIDLSNEAYKLGVNYVVYAMTH